MVEALLIEKVRGYAFLYDVKHKQYRDSIVRQTAWEEIGKELRMQGPAAKEMWDKLRRCFMNARNRSLEVKRSGAGAKKKVVWKFEGQMAFLLPFLESRKTRSNLNETHQELQIDTQEIPDCESPQLDRNSIDPEGNDGAEFGDHEVQSHQTAAAPIHESVEMAHPKKRKEHNSSSAQHQLVDILKESAALRKKKYEEKGQSQGSQGLGGMDEMDLFFLSMSRMTKNLPKLEQARIKLQISNLVLSAEIHDQQSNPQNDCIVRPHSSTTIGTSQVGTPTPGSTATSSGEIHPTLLDLTGVSFAATDDSTYHTLQ